MARWAHVALNCRDIRVTEDFYCRHFNFSRARHLQLKEFGEIVYLRNGEAFLELRQADPCSTVHHESFDGSHTAGNIRHLAISVDNIEDVLVKVGAETRVRMGPVESGTERFAWIEDPDGVVIEVNQGFIEHD